MTVACVTRNLEQALGADFAPVLASLVQSSNGHVERLVLLAEEPAPEMLRRLPSTVEFRPLEKESAENKEMFLSDNQKFSYRVLRTLRRLAKETQLSAVHFFGDDGEAFATIRARRMLNEFPGVRLVLHPQAPRGLRLDTAAIYPTTLCDLEMENYSVAHVDLVVTSSDQAAEHFRLKSGRKDVRSLSRTNPGSSLENFLAELPTRKETWRTGSNRLVSVIVPFYNQGRYLEETLASVRQSTHPSVEIVVVNDGSTDPASNAVFERLDGVVKVQKANGGLGSARNAGIKASTGEYLLMLDADDKIHPDYLKLAVEALENNPRLAYVTSHVRSFGELNFTWVPIGFVPSLMPFLNTSGASANVFRRAAFEVATYDEKIMSEHGWDLLLTFHELGLEGDVLPADLFLYRRHYDSMLFTVSNPRRHAVTQMLMSRHPRLMAEHAPTMALVLAHLWKWEELRKEQESPLSERLEACQKELETCRKVLDDYGLLPSAEQTPRPLQRAIFRALGNKMRRSLRKRMATVSRSLLDGPVPQQSVLKNGQA